MVNLELNLRSSENKMAQESRIRSDSLRELWRASLRITQQAEHRYLKHRRQRRAGAAIIDAA
jgi:hypothetical protein